MAWAVRGSVMAGLLSTGRLIGNRSIDCQSRADKLCESLDRRPAPAYLTVKLLNRSVHHRMPPDRLSTTLSALADPTRRAILARLALGETSVTELAKPVDRTGPAISKHLKVLERAGLIARGRVAQWRPCRLEGAPLRDVADWLEHYPRFWDERLDPLGHYLHQMQMKAKAPCRGQ